MNQIDTQQTHQAYPSQTININVGDQSTTRSDSYFDGKLSQLIGIYILAILITLMTLGIAFPWGFARVYRWEIEHTVINGRRLRFSGTASGLFAHWIKWLLLTLITFGVYSFWLRIKLIQWKTKHTYFN